jgi:hypothetical protein
MLDSQSASLSWCQAPIWGLRPDFYYCQTFAGLLMWGALSDKRTGLPFTIAAGPRQRSHPWFRIPRDSWPYFTVSDSRLPPTWRARSPYLYPPGTGWLQLYPKALGFFFVASCDSQGYGGGIGTPSSRGSLLPSQSQSYFTTGGLPPINLSWRQAPWDSWPELLLPTAHSSRYIAAARPI